MAERVSAAVWSLVHSGFVDDEVDLIGSKLAY